MNNTFNGKTALIIGGSSGMGKATAQLLLTRGAKVVIASKSRDSVDAAVAELKNYGAVTGKVVNLRSEQEVDSNQPVRTTTLFSTSTGAFILSPRQ